MSELTGGREIARRIAMGKGEPGDWPVLLDWLMENPGEVNNIPVSPDEIRRAIVSYGWARTPSVVREDEPPMAAIAIYPPEPFDVTEYFDD